MNHLEAFWAAVQADAALIHKPENIRWLSGYTGEGCLLITADAHVVLTDSRYTEQTRRQAPDWELVELKIGDTYPRLVAELAKRHGVRRMLVETDHLTYDGYQSFATALEGVELASMGGIPEKLREIKDEAELASIRRAASIASNALMNILPRIHAGLTEKQVQRMLDNEMLELGSEGVAFDTIAAAGINGALPHAVPSDKALENGELFTLDFGATVDGYRSDMTRTLAVGKISDQLRDLYETVREGQQMGLDALAAGKRCCDVDKLVRDFVCGRYPVGGFGHGLGHCVGLLIHEDPRFNPVCTDVLKPGHVITVEPGIYVPGLGGCRIEDTVIITEDGYINTISAPKHLIEI